MKRMLFIASMLFTVTRASSYVWAAPPPVHGTVTKINGSQVTVRDAFGKESIVKGNGVNCRVGDKVLYHDGGITAVDSPSDLSKPAKPNPPDPRASKINTSGGVQTKSAPFTTPELPPPPPKNEPCRNTRPASEAVTVFGA